MEKVGRRRRNPGSWKRLLQRHAESGLTVEQFCRQEGVGPNSFYRWRTRLGAAVDHPVAVCGAMPLTPAFLDLGPVVAKAATPPSLDLKLDLGCGITLHLTRS